MWGDRAKVQVAGTIKVLEKNNQHTSKLQVTCHPTKIRSLGQIKDIDSESKRHTNSTQAIKLTISSKALRKRNVKLCSLSMPAHPNVLTQSKKSSLN